MASGFSEIEDIIKAIITDSNYASDLISMAIEQGLSPISLARLFRIIYLEELHMLPFSRVVNEPARFTPKHRFNTKMRFDPRQIIKHMLDSHKATKQNIQVSEKRAESITIQNIIQGVPQKIFTFSMNNSFSEDINFICLTFITRGTFYDKLLGREKFVHCINILKKKYNIITKRTPDSYFDETSITIPRIAMSFPGVVVNLFHVGYGKCPNRLQLFPEHNLPRVIFSPMIASVLPKQDDSPLAITLAIAVVCDDDVHQTDAKTELTALHQCLLTWYNSTALTEELKMIYCENWGLGKRRDATFTYSDVVIGARQRAKDIIRSSRSADWAIDQVLSLV